MLEEATNSDLLPLIANIACEEVHILRIMQDTRMKIVQAKRQGNGEKLEELRRHVDSLSVMLDNKRMTRQGYQKEYWGVPPDFNDKEENRRTFLGEWGCLFKHEVTVWYHEMEILEKHCRKLCEAQTEEESREARRLRDMHLKGMNISADMIDKLTEQIRDNLGLNKETGKEEAHATA